MGSLMDVWTLPESEKFLVSGLCAKFGCSRFGKPGLSYAFGPKVAQKEPCYFSADGAVGPGLRLFGQLTQPDALSFYTSGGL